MAFSLVAEGAGAEDAGSPAATRIVDGLAPVGPQNTSRAGAAGFMEIDLQPEPGRGAKTVLGTGVKGPGTAQLRQLHAAGRAAGLDGILYDNRDDGHSQLGRNVFPQLSVTRYDPRFRNEGLHYGAAGRLRFSLPTVGNSSTALTSGPLWRSLGRQALAGQAAAMQAHALYRANHLYIYPEHRDHDPDRGDLFFAKTPYLLVSQGSSRSDQPLLFAALAAAALPPATQALAIENGALPATLQMLIHSTLVGVEGRDDYMSGLAHPSALPSEALDLERLVAAAASLPASDLPPVVDLDILTDFEAVPGRDYLAETLGENIFTTPSAIARAWRSFAHTRRLVLSAEATRDPNGRPLRFHWVVLRGLDDRVRITPRGDDAGIAEIEIDWHDRYPVPGDPDLMTQRVDIGVFADNGVAISAPAVLSIAFPAHQNRVYEPGPDGTPHLASVSYGASATQDRQNYADPLLWPVARWTDSLAYGPDGSLQVIRRTLRDGKHLTLRHDGLGFSADTVDGPVPVRHIALTDETGRLILRALTADGRPAAAPADQ